jgi:hypothetical protein
MSIEEEMLALSGVVAAQRERIEAMEELILDLHLLMGTRFEFTWNNGQGLLIQQRMKELGIVKERATP